MNPAVTMEPIADGVTKVELHRPEKLNALNRDVIDGLRDAALALRGDRSTRVVVLTGAGRGFSAGLDLGGYGDLDPDRDPDAPALGKVQRGFALQTQIAGAVSAWRDLQQPVIAAVNGPASGGGMAIALGADIRIASEAARFNVAFIHIGVSGCDMGVSWLLPRLIGASRAWELMLTGRMLDASEAADIGLVVRVVPGDVLLDAALETATQIINNSPWAVRMTKEVMWSQLEVGSFRAGMDLENRTQVLSGFTEDHREALLSVIEHRPPAFSGR